MENRLRHKTKLITDINMVPFTDVVLVLLVIFMVTTPFLFQGDFQVSLPKVAAPNPNIPEALTLTVAQGGRLALNGQEIKFEELAEKIGVLMKQNPNQQVVIEADSGVSHGTVMGVMGEAYAAGVTKMGIAVEQSHGSVVEQNPSPAGAQNPGAAVAPVTAK